MNKGFESFLRDVEAQSLPPVDQWQPQHEGKIDLNIDSQGLWYYQGTVFQRNKLVKLLASILGLDEAGNYFLISPVEKLYIQVADVPFVVLGAECDQTSKMRNVILETNVGEKTMLNSTHRWELREYRDQLIPYVEIRSGLFARVSRTVYYQLVEWCEESIQGNIRVFGFWSNDCFFSLGEVTW
ncbi:MAG: hypothetical protein ACI8P9_003953 [Parasphingorhabdus sp.]|jgi:hypothetical protein